MKKALEILPKILAIFAVALIISIGVFLYSYDTGKRETAEDLLHAFYTMELDTAHKNDVRIKELVPEDLYERFTLASSNRQLRVYLKFQGHPTEAVIIGHKDNLITYYIKSEGFDDQRTFGLKYEYRWGKIVEVAEFELFPLPQTNREHFQ